MIATAETTANNPEDDPDSQAQACQKQPPRAVYLAVMTRMIHPRWVLCKGGVPLSSGYVQKLLFCSVASKIGATQATYLQLGS